MIPGELLPAEQEYVTNLQYYQQKLIDEAMKGMPPQWHPRYQQEWRTRLQRALSSPEYLRLGKEIADVYWRSVRPFVIVELENDDGSKDDAPRDRREDARVGAGEP